MIIIIILIFKLKQTYFYIDLNPTVLMNRRLKLDRLYSTKEVQLSDLTGNRVEWEEKFQQFQTKAVPGKRGTSRIRPLSPIGVHQYNSKPHKKSDFDYHKARQTSADFGGRATDTYRVNDQRE